MSNNERFRITTLDTLVKEREGSKEIKKGYPSDVKILFTPADATTYLEMYLEDQSRRALCYGPFKGSLDQGEKCEMVSDSNTFGSPTVEAITNASSDGSTDENMEGINPDDDELQEIADKIYKDIVLSWRWDSQMLDICRKGKLTKKMVRASVDQACEDIQEEIAEEGSVNPFGKALAKSIKRVSSELGIDLLKSLRKGFADFDEITNVIMKTSVGYPYRVVMFLKSVNKEDVKKIVGK